MTNQLNFSSKNTVLNSAKLWLFCKILLLILVSGALLSAFNIAASGFLIVNLVAGCIVIAILLWIKFKPAAIQFIKIENQQLRYYCPVKKEEVTIPVNEIVNVTSHFCELEIHTENKTYCIDLRKIKEEKQRWEIKEMVKKLPEENEKRVVNF